MIIKSQFTPAPGLHNPHLQTLFPSLIYKRSGPDFIEQSIELDDGDFLDLAWTHKPRANKPIVVLFHGLEGSSNSHYIKGLMASIQRTGWTGVLMHFRGCSARQNRLARSYHSGDTADAKYMLSWLQQQYPDSPLAAVGFSLGGNMLLKLLAELGTKSPLLAAVSVCAPLVLNDCALRLQSGFSRFYQKHLLNCLKSSLLEKAKYHDYSKLINLDIANLDQIKSFRTFDDLVTAPLNGFKDVDDYYKQCSSRQYLNQIKTPALIIHSLDDPFMTPDTAPEADELSDSVVLELSETGGHVGFVGGSLFKPEYWLDSRVPDFLSGYLEAPV